MTHDPARGLSRAYTSLPKGRRHAIACASFAEAETEAGRAAYSNALALDPCPAAARFAAMIADDKARKGAAAATLARELAALSPEERRSRAIREMREMLSDDVTHAQRVAFIKENLVTAGPEGLRTDSLAVAALYGRNHQHVLRSIRELLEDVPDVLSSFGQYEEITRNVQGAERRREVYTMDRRGFGLLSASFTGREARRWTAAYITALEVVAAEYRESIRRQEVEACFGREIRRLLR